MPSGAHSSEEPAGGVNVALSVPSSYSVGSGVEPRQGLVGDAGVDVGGDDGGDEALEVGRALVVVLVGAGPGASRRSRGPNANGKSATLVGSACAPPGRAGAAVGGLHQLHVGVAGADVARGRGSTSGGGRRRGGR